MIIHGHHPLRYFITYKLHDYLFSRSLYKEEFMSEYVAVSYDIIQELKDTFDNINSSVNLEENIKKASRIVKKLNMPKRYAEHDYFTDEVIQAYKENGFIRDRPGDLFLGSDILIKLDEYTWRKATLVKYNTAGTWSVSVIFKNKDCDDEYREEVKTWVVFENYVKG